MEFKKKGKKADENELRYVESQIGLFFPDDLREFILNNEGCVPDNNEFSVLGRKGWAGVNKFLSLKEILAEKIFYRNRMPNNACPIAYAEGGNLICFVYGQKTGIYFWDHELEAEDMGDSYWDNMFLIGNNFSDFLHHIKEFDISNVKLQEGQVINKWIDPDFKPEFD